MQVVTLPSGETIVVVVQAQLLLYTIIAAIASTIFFIIYSPQEGALSSCQSSDCTVVEKPTQLNH